MKLLDFIRKIIIKMCYMNENVKQKKYLEIKRMKKNCVDLYIINKNIIAND